MGAPEGGGMKLFGWLRWSKVFNRRRAVDTRTPVRPIREILNDKGTVWESLLYRAGWNDLPYALQRGEVVAAYSNGTFDVHFPALEHTSKAVFGDEIILNPSRRRLVTVV